MKIGTTLIPGVLACLLLTGLASPTFGGDKKRAKHVAQWPDVDLSPYELLFIEDFEVNDPKAHKRKKAMQVQTTRCRSGRPTGRERESPYPVRRPHCDTRPTA